MAKTETKAGIISTATLNAFVEKFPTKEDWELKLNEEYSIIAKKGAPWPEILLIGPYRDENVSCFSTTFRKKALTIFVGGGYIENLPAFVFEVA